MTRLFLRATGAVAALLVSLFLAASSGAATGGSPGGVATPLWRISFEGDFSNVSDLQELWQAYSVELTRKESPVGSVMARVHYARRFSQDGIQIEWEAYPRLGPGRYGYVNAAYSGSGIFPHWRSSAEIFQSLPQAWEISAGAMHFRFPTVNFMTYTGSLAKYAGNDLYSLRPYLTVKPDGTSLSVILKARHYFGDADEFMDVTLGTGTSSTQVLTASDLNRTGSWTLSLSAQKPISIRQWITWGVGFSQETLPSGALRNVAGGKAGVKFLW